MISTPGERGVRKVSKVSKIPTGRIGRIGQIVRSARVAFSAWLAFLACVLLIPGAALAHKASDSYLALKVQGGKIEGQWDIALRDLDFAIGLDTNGDGEITWGELRARHADIDAYALARLSLGTGTAACPLRVTQHLVDNHTDGAYSVLRLAAECPHEISTLDVRYMLLFDLDPQHKGLLRFEYPGAGNEAAVKTAIFSPDKPQQALVAAEVSPLGQFIDYARSGVWHIWIGFDHILFLLSLLLPAVLYLVRGRWQAVERFNPAFWDVFRIVTSFTVAHSITLSLATLGLIALPSRVVESAIAASVVLAALNNLYPLFQGRRWMVAFCFGLIHGFGFASVLADMGLPRGALALALVGFNLGVEAGQLTIVAVFLPTAYLLRHGWFYRRLVFTAGSWLIVLIAAIWFAERAFDLKLISA